MTPQQKIKHMLIIWEIENGYDKERLASLPKITADNVDDVLNLLEEDEALWDARSETREGEVETGLPSEWSRHYESKSVAAKYVDGSWVGWTYWYGGGKHAEPEAIDWIEDAYDLSCFEEEKMVTVRTFSKTDAQ